ncbi:hypothetical protein YA38_08875 [Klebsiella aerogenes]|nr:hypothetical protein YA38_08875 [Klebsiella aerogenes]
MKKNFMEKYIWRVYILLSVMSGYIFNYFSIKILALFFAAIFSRIITWNMLSTHRYVDYD